jgi:RNA recognition motif-containing protein
MSKSPNSLFVGNLPIFCTEDSLREVFVPHGEVINVHIKRGEKPGHPLLYAFVEFRNQDQTKRGLKCHGKDCLGRNLK